MDRVVYQPGPPLATALSEAIGGHLAWRTGDVRHVASLGEVDGPVALLFGNIQDVAVDSHGYVYVLDDRFNDVRVISPNGSQVFRFGRRGGGPGEFRRPTAVFLTADDNIIITDVARRLHLYRRTGDSVVHHSSLSVGGSPNDGCASQGGYILQVSTLDAPELLERYSSDAVLGLRFAPVYQTENALVRHALSEGHVSCGSDGTIYLAPKNALGDLRSYAADGSARWVHRVHGLRPPRIVASGAAGVAVELPPNGFHRTESLTLLNEQHLLLQIAQVASSSRGAAGETTQLYSFLFDARSGVLLCGSTNVPLMYAAAHGRVVTKAPVEAPRIDIWVADIPVGCDRSSI